tara:strand:- start:174 stop:392 length:219 start_codon:yes stop_codon:yes gene_type:complete
MEYRILETLEELKSLIKTNHHNKWMNIREVCDYTSVSESTIRRAVKKSVLKASNQTGRLLFKRINVDNWLEG